MSPRHAPPGQPYEVKTMSSSKRPSLAAAMQLAAKPARAEQPEPPPPATALAAAERGPGFYAATRTGKKKVTAPLSEEAHKQFRVLAAERGAKGEALLIEALNDLFQKYGKPPIA